MATTLCSLHILDAKPEFGVDPGNVEKDPAYSEN